MKKWILLLILIQTEAFGLLQISTTTTDLAALARELGKDKVEVFAIAKGTQDPHQIEAKPSYMVKLRGSDLVIAQGLELESAWLGPLIHGSRNPKLTGKSAVLELGADLDPIEKARASASRADGDVHPGGNPHFQMDPIRLGMAGELIARRLGQLDPGNKEFFETNAAAFKKRLAERTLQWQARIKKSGITEVVTYHKTFSYFCERFQLRCDLQLEPKPGIPPTASHLLDVIAQMKQRKISLVLVENIFSETFAEKMKNEIPGLWVKSMPISVEGAAGTSTNEELIETLVKAFEEKP